MSSLLERRVPVVGGGGGWVGGKPKIVISDELINKWLSAQNLHLIQTHETINMCNSYSVLRVCGKCFWEGCKECTEYCHEKLGCHGKPITYSYTIQIQGKKRCPWICSSDASTQTDAHAQDDKIEGSVPVLSQQSGSNFLRTFVVHRQHSPWVLWHHQELPGVPANKFW